MVPALLSRRRRHTSRIYDLSKRSRVSKLIDFLCPPTSSPPSLSWHQTSHLYNDLHFLYYNTRHYFWLVSSANEYQTLWRKEVIAITSMTRSHQRLHQVAKEHLEVERESKHIRPVKSVLACLMTTRKRQRHLVPLHWQRNASVTMIPSLRHLRKAQEVLQKEKAWNGNNGKMTSYDKR